MDLDNLILGLQIIQQKEPNARWKNHAYGIRVKYEIFLWTDTEVNKLESLGWYEHEGCWILFDR